MKLSISRNTIKQSNYSFVQKHLGAFSNPKSNKHTQCLSCSPQPECLIASSFTLGLTVSRALVGFSDLWRHILLTEAQDKSGESTNSHRAQGSWAWCWGQLPGRSVAGTLALGGATGPHAESTTPAAKQTPSALHFASFIVKAKLLSGLLFGIENRC